ncbi:hypothetical protein [Marinimicrobium alkaliphilum]|uniref:hypothetical protein n=1 Tax=Marinimicrobium alkaliphilum TaxID=2202654 RepID=UPI0018E07274|nr:hypothetical protein [Marinimicrobium alkaliphilum]
MLITGSYVDDVLAVHDASAEARRHYDTVMADSLSSVSYESYYEYYVNLENYVSYVFSIDIDIDTFSWACAVQQEAVNVYSSFQGRSDQYTSENGQLINEMHYGVLMKLENSIGDCKRWRSAL